VTTTVLQAYRFAVDPTPEQEAALRSHCGGQRYAFNWGLALVKANLGQRQAETSYGIPVDELTPAVPWSAYSLRKLWNQAKDEIARMPDEGKKLLAANPHMKFFNAQCRYVRVNVNRRRWCSDFRVVAVRDDPGSPPVPAMSWRTSAPASSRADPPREPPSGRAAPNRARIESARLFATEGPPDV
jgi:hypothetical protein